MARLGFLVLLSGLSLTGGRLAGASEIGPNDFRISFMGGTGDATDGAFSADAVYNPMANEYLVVWRGDGETAFDGDFEIYGRRVSPDGTLLGERITISQMRPSSSGAYTGFSPAVAYNAIDNEYLVVWTGDQSMLGGVVDGEYEIWGQRLDGTTGVEIGANDFRISDMGGTGDPAYGAALPAVVHNSIDNEYLVVWSGDDDVGGLVAQEMEIFGQRLDASGVEIGANDFRISDMGCTGDPAYDARSPAAAYNPVTGQYLVVWSGDDSEGGLVDNEREIFGQRLDPSGVELGENDFRISDMGGSGDSSYSAFAPAVAYAASSGEYLVVWVGDDSEGGVVDNELEVWGQRLDGLTGIELGENDFRISDIGGTGDPSFTADSFTAVAYDMAAGEYWAIWAAEDPDAGLGMNEVEIFGQRLDASTGSEVGENDFRISDIGATGAPEYAECPAIAAGPGMQVLVVWDSEEEGLGMADNEWEIFGQLLESGLFGDRFESGDTGAWSAVFP